MSLKNYDFSDPGVGIIHAYNPIASATRTRVRAAADNLKMSGLFSKSLA